MLDTSEAFSGFSVDDLDKAMQFYGGVLGLTVSRNEMGMLELQIPGSRFILVYPKPNHEPASYTILNFPVRDIDDVARELTGRGVTFERYEGFPGEVSDLGVYRGAGPDIAWFKDPAGNTLSLIGL